MIGAVLIGISMQAAAQVNAGDSVVNRERSSRFSVGG